MLIKNRIIIPVVTLFVTLLILLGCDKKPGGSYDFVNKESVFDGSLYEYLQSKPGVYDSLLKIIDRIGWAQEVLKGNDEMVTVFAPVNGSVSAALRSLNIVRQQSGKAPLSIETLDLPELDTLLNFYVVQGYYPTDSMLFTDGLFFQSMMYGDSLHAQRIIEGAQGMLDGGPVNVRYSFTNASNFEKDWIDAYTNVVNIKAINGCAHGLSFKHEFGFSQFITRMNK